MLQRMPIGQRRAADVLDLADVVLIDPRRLHGPQRIHRLDLDRRPILPGIVLHLADILPEPIKRQAGAGTVLVVLPRRAQIIRPLFAGQELGPIVRLVEIVLPILFGFSLTLARELQDFLVVRTLAVLLFRCRSLCHSYAIHPLSCPYIGTTLPPRSEFATG